MIEGLKEKYGLDLFKTLDDSIRDKSISSHYYTKYGEPYHLVTLSQILGYKKRPVEINEYIASITDFTGNPTYFSSLTLSKFYKIFTEEDFPKFSRTMRDYRKRKVVSVGHYDKTKKTKKESKPKMLKGKCMECESKYEVDINKHPSNLCVCLDCAPNGLRHTTEGHRSQEIHRTGR